MFRFSPNPNDAHRIHWQDWGPAAFERARDEGKPVMLFLGAFWCGVCQRMDETTLSHTEVIALLNAYFVPVRVEDAQRPDIDVRYNRNGWPTIVFMSAEGDYLAGINYLSATDFTDVLVRIHVGYQERGTDSGTDPAATVSTGPDPAAWSTVEPEREAPASSAPVTTSAPSSPAAVPHHASPENPSPDPGTLDRIAETVWRLADPVHGGYEIDRKFPHCEVNEFLLLRHQATGDARFLNHVRLTLYNMHQSKTHDPEGGFFRYSSKRDWSEPHHEKLLADHAGLLDNALHVFELTRESFFRELAEELLEYLQRGFRDPSMPFFHGCRDYIRVTPGRDDPPGSLPHRNRGMFSITDPWMYTDANARAVRACLRAARTLGRQDCAEHALATLRLLLERSWDGTRGMAHYFDDAPRLRGLLADQVWMGRALISGFETTHDSLFRQRAEVLADFVRARLRNPAGGYFDIAEKGPAYLHYPLTLITENGAAARFFLELFDLTGKAEHRDAALWALKCFVGDFADYGVHVAEYGTALGEYVARADPG
ncbi:MAG: DUF255 domain-containing protein [Deltaproteobacteria bacterium]|nr:DUF255 domain-containing protein [Deltaproteobacteria bacterium]